jgi:hypothetical protein
MMRGLLLVGFVTGSLLSSLSAAEVPLVQNDRAAAAVDTGVRNWPAPDGEALSEHYELRVNGQAVPVYACRVSAVPFNQVWPGYQRPLDQTELAGNAQAARLQIGPHVQSVRFSETP